MNLADSLRIAYSLLVAHLWRDVDKLRPTRHPGMRARSSKALLRQRRKAERQARRRQRQFA